MVYKMKLSFVILAYKEIDHLRLCIRNIEDLHLYENGIEYEIIFADNGSKNGLVEMVNEMFPHVRIVKNGGNLGHPAGNNRGISKAQGEYVVMINPDIIFRSLDDVKRIVNYLDSHEDVAFLGPKLMNPNGMIQNSCYRRYTLWTPIYRRTFLGKFGFGKKDIARHLMLDFDHNQTQEVDWLLGACIFLRKKAIDQVGLMNEDLFLYFGDYEWCDRVHAANWKVVYFHDVEKIFHYHHRESASSRFSVAQMLSYVTRIHIKDWLTYLKISKN
ncbi:MAG: glycosyltransferase family 2 protein, partial [Candidatus Thermoplasmatota archaeon]|nr:glycosyltransferase family 2 protein [Candidatus Thermoplasmatota archaeon]MBU1940562.1 glycosyltransferase family 2 protein [Candidatus Thermoplasmatota archaeon]